MCPNPPSHNLGCLLSGKQVTPDLGPDAGPALYLGQCALWMPAGRQGGGPQVVMGMEQQQQYIINWNGIPSPAEAQRGGTARGQFQGSQGYITDRACGKKEMADRDL